MARPILHFSRASAHAPLHSKVMSVGHLLQPFHSKMDFGVLYFYQLCYGQHPMMLIIVKKDFCQIF